MEIQGESLAECFRGPGPAITRVNGTDRIIPFFAIEKKF